MIRALALAAVLVAATEASHQLYGDSPLYPIHPKLISQSVHLNEVPTKIIKITKTVAVKVPVPYPVKVPHHVPVAVPVHQPVAVPVPQIVRVPHHVPVPVARPYPVALPQQVPVFVHRTLALPQPVPVPQPVAVPSPVFLPLPYNHQQEAPSNLDASSSDFGATQYGAGGEEPEDRLESQHFADTRHFGYFRPSQPDYGSDRGI